MNVVQPFFGGVGLNFTEHHQTTVDDVRIPIGANMGVQAVT